MGVKQRLDAATKIQNGIARRCGGWREGYVGLGFGGGYESGEGEGIYIDVFFLFHGIYIYATLSSLQG